jgi:CBS domain-containing protein
MKSPDALVPRSPIADSVLAAVTAISPEDGEELEEDDGAFSDRFAIGTGQFDLRGPEFAAAGVEAPLSLIMVRRVACARPDMSASEARQRMLERGISGLPVVDDWGRVIGMLSRSDLLDHEVTSEDGGVRVADIMMPLVFWLPPDAPIGQAAALMAYEGIQRVVIVDRGGHLQGLVTSLDVARWVGRSAGYPVGVE